MINADNPPDLKQYIDNAEPYAEAAETPLAESDTPAGVQKPKKVGVKPSFAPAP